MSTKRFKGWKILHAEDFQNLAEIRMKEAETLLANQKFDGAFYLAGYAVECALKACIASGTGQGDFPPEWRVVRENFYTHSLEALHGTVLNTSTSMDAKQLGRRPEGQWAVVKEWTEKSRYEIHNEKKAKDMITSSRGVMAWLKNFW